MESEDKKKQFASNLVLTIANKKMREGKPLKDFEVEVVTKDEEAYWKKVYSSSDTKNKYGFYKRILGGADPEIRARIDDIISCGEPSRAMVFISSCQRPMQAYFGNMQLFKKYPQIASISLDRGLPFYEKRINQVAMVIAKKGTYEQILSATTYLGTDIVDLLTYAYVKGQEEGLSEDKIRKDFQKVMNTRASVEGDLIDYIYAGYKVVNYICDNAKSAIEQNIKELKQGKTVEEIVEEK